MATNISGRIALAVLTLCAGVVAARAEEEAPASAPASAPAATGSPRPAADLARGARLYRQRCAACHGREGRGDGTLADDLDPRPRDFTRGTYKLRSTPSGRIPTDADLFETITRGLPGTSMSGWAGLSTADRWQLVYFVKSLSPRFARRPAPPPLIVPPAPVVTHDLVERGAAVYVEMRCGECHGADGRGDGPAAWQLVDDQKRRIYPFDMTRGWKLKAGREPERIYRVLHTGLDGTPMPSYHDVLSEEDSWALVFFVRSLFVDTAEAP